MNTETPGLIKIALGVLRWGRDLLAALPGADSEALAGFAQALLAAAIGPLAAIPVIAAFAWVRNQTRVILTGYHTPAGFDR